MTNSQPYMNRGLYSDYYLDSILPETQHWRTLLGQAQPVFDELKTIYAKLTPSKKEGQTEHDYIRPILDALKHNYNIQPSLKTAAGTKQPDYVLYKNSTQANDAKDHTLDDTLPQHGGLAVAEAKYWNRPLDQAIHIKNADALSNKNPAYQIYFYVQQSGVAWGILTNGKLWRLVHKDTAHKLDCYYEINLSDLLKTGSPEDFLYFYAFFSRVAFEVTNPIGLTNILKQSADYAIEVGKTLKRQVFEALRHIAQGFFDFDGNQLSVDKATLENVYDNALILLYRLLFILYAEGRDLLPVSKSSMYSTFYGLYAIKQKLAQLIDAGEFLLPTTDTLWHDLKQLFRFINEGMEPLSITTFNGGLFDPEKHPFLEQYTVGDSHLMQAIDRLARVSHNGKRQFVDYRDLAVRDLGTIYEGLLEFQPSIGAPDPGWKIDLLNDKGERKASGSYYTPDTIVKYIVEQTLGPILDRAVANKHNAHARTEAILNVKVLDPAMGSGHFLVEAVEYIARYLVNLTPDEVENSPAHDLTYWKRRVAQSCIYGVDLNPLAVELAQLSLWLTTVAQDLPLSFLSHHLRPGNAIVGARLNQLHWEIKLGRVTRTEEFSLFADDSFVENIKSAVDMMKQIETNEGSSALQTKEQEKRYEELRATLTSKYRKLANLITANSFGADVDSKLRTPLEDYVNQRNLEQLPAAIADLLEQHVAAAEKIAKERYFFHWELEFPEIFFDRFGRSLGMTAGFDAIIGNPPYDVLKRDRDQPERNQFIDYVRAEARYKPAASQTLNIFQLMIMQALNHVKRNGLLGQIVPLSLLSDRSAMGTRRLMLEQTCIKDIQAFPQKDDENNRVFEDAKLSTMIFIAAANSVTATLKCRVHPGKDILSDSPQLNIQVADIRKFDPEALAVPMGMPEETSILQRVYNQPFIVPAGKMIKVLVGEVDMTIDRGVVSPTPTQHELIKGAHLQRYSLRTEPKQGQREWVDNFALSSSKMILASQARLSLQGITGTDDSRRLKATIVPAGYYLANSVNFVTPTQDGVDTLFVLAMLNSRFHEWRFRLTSTNNNVNNYELEALPFLDIQFRAKLERTHQVELAKQHHHTGQYEATLNLVNACLTVTPPQSDVVHDILAYLAQQMLDLNRKHQTAVENLLLYLEGHLTPAQLQKLARLWTPPIAGKTMDADARQMLGNLADRRIDLRSDIGAISEPQWKWLLKQRLNRITNLADLVAVYRLRQPTVAALDARRHATDHLIDRIVYALYDLTPDEINTIETRLLQHMAPTDTG